MKTRVFLLVTTVMMIFKSPSASAALFSLGVEPIIGYERVQKVLPSPHTKNRMLYGARLSLGVPLIALEAELTRGTDTETSASTTLKDTDDKAKIGLRSTLRMTSLLSFQLRAGAQGKRNTHEETTGGNTTKTVSAISYKPYGGAGVSTRLLRNLTGNLGVTAVFNKFPDMSQNDYETTASFTVRFP